MIEESKKNEFWNFLTTEKNQLRPRGITTQRLAVIKPIALESDLWLDVIERHGATNRAAQEFYQSAEAASTNSRTTFWEAVRGIILLAENERKNTDRQNRNAPVVEKAGKSSRSFKKNVGKRF
ncbi:MAG: hypothetical protein M3388_04920 [Acidobacteriota bacterium]|nr:hypothetical protein [Acidobacteriota bacterium]